MEYFCYTGDVKKLIPNGWTFQKLYARNYRTYRKNGIIMYVVSKMILELDNVRSIYQKYVVGFILDNIKRPESFWVSPSGMFTNYNIPNWVIQEGRIITRREAVLNKRDWHLEWEKDNNIPYLEDGERISLEWVQAVKELVKLGGVELREVS